MAPPTFERFADLPAELRLKIWNEALAGPSMHVFDVCFYSWRGSDRSKRAFQDSNGNIPEPKQSRWKKYDQCAFLDTLEAGATELARSTQVARHAHDPSVYRLRQAQRSTSVEAAAAVAGPARRRQPNTNTVYLPGRDEKVVYDNDKDVLFLRFRDGGALSELTQGVLFGEYDTVGPSNLSQILEGPWCAEMASTLHGAKHIALDVAETWTTATVGAVMLEEVAYLGCCLQHDLRVLYLVDHCPGRCTRCNRQDKRTAQLQSRGDLYRRLHSTAAEEAMTREPDVIWGVGKTYREVFDFEGLGWSDAHPSYVFARAMEETIRSQQADAKAEVFQGVRVLVVEDENVDGLDTTTLMDCNPENISNRDRVWEMSLRWSS
nr:uncharacterized protein CTRU02_14059 [Colletotrichum truncatum]KAF6782578.1 hypothetical protein CTRU02_14059 [Colletotrichum truncatum]